MIHQLHTLPRAIKRSALVFALTASQITTAFGAPALSAPAAAPLQITHLNATLAGSATRIEISAENLSDKALHTFAPTAIPAAASEDSQVQSTSSSTPQTTTGITASRSASGSTSTPQAQGQQYGQAGFVGEPINLNVVNADIRDILNYITEQYGVNFVIDNSVGAIPVTVNVTDVPWNVALDAILRANRLGIETNGNILRVATQQVLATEAALQERIRDAQLNSAPLVTEFIRLNYARANGTLAQAAGSTGGFAGGTTSDSFSGGAGGDATGGGGEQGILPIISRRLSRRGAVEVDGRSNTLIITDVKENIDAIRQLVSLLDQPEPQVEIETRIVLATRNFSRDIGVQITGSVGNSSTGGNITGGTLPGSIGNVPGMIVAPAVTGALGAAAPNTSIGLTTGIFGTAQISAALTAAESKGQIKIVANPRVTVLNNRPAQIETGQQIPVVTAQPGANGGVGVFTTTFVSVPLRLSVTPQITDAGTVIMRIVAENNSVNSAIAAGGTPGIDTQRMQSEVLVPDGGTTVIGGALNDNEVEVLRRTPGIANIPVFGNLFKRRTTSRDTVEILFFITPRIYRPDYQGRPIAVNPVNGSRSMQIAQPVELGNPSTNTPTPTQLQRQQPTIAPQNLQSPTSINAPNPTTNVTPGVRPQQ